MMPDGLTRKKFIEWARLADEAGFHSLGTLDRLNYDSWDVLTVLAGAQLSNEVAAARQTIHSRYAVPVNWFSYPSGAYNPTVTAAVRAAGYVGATTLIPGWASTQDDRFRLPRLQVVGGTTPAGLLSQIATAQANAAPPAASPGG